MLTPPVYLSVVCLTGIRILKSNAGQETHICLCLQVSGTDLNDQVPWGNGTFGEALLAPTIIYVQRLLSLLDVADVKVCLSVQQASTLRRKCHASTSRCAPLSVP